jgi:hypothetical protein
MIRRTNFYAKSIITPPVITRNFIEQMNLERTSSLRSLRSLRRLRELAQISNSNSNSNSNDNVNKYILEVGEENDISSCSICLEKIDYETISKISCNHYFHTTCIKLWLEKNLSCPCCRTKPKTSSIDYDEIYKIFSSISKTDLDLLGFN